MLIAHEAPISILENVDACTSYSYALVHLFETHPEYYNHFVRALARGREVILDNSIFELGESFDPKKYANYVRKLKPTFYIVPDVLESASETMSSFKKFTLNYPDLPGKKIGVVQGKTYQELVDCYKFMSQHADYIAISFDYSWYETVGYSDRSGDTDESKRLAKLDQYCMGRPLLIKRLSEDGVWNSKKPHHLLGCSLAREFKHYPPAVQRSFNIRSCDTSNPVVAGLKGHRYLKDIGLDFKPSTLLADLIDAEVDTDQFNDIFNNIMKFRNLF